MIEEIKIWIEQYNDPFDDADAISVVMTDEQADDVGRKVYIRQTETLEDSSEKKNEIFISGKDTLNSLIEALEFIRSRKGWTPEERR
jgi:hypothetical protein